MTGEQPSGLRNPAAAVRGVGAGTLAVEAVVLLLAIQPLRTLGGPRADAAVWAAAGLAVAALALVGLLRWRWVWAAGAGLQLALVGAGLLHWSMAVLGLVFGAVWGYLLYVRRRVLG